MPKLKITKRALKFSIEWCLKEITFTISLGTLRQGKEDHVFETNLVNYSTCFQKSSYCKKYLLCTGLIQFVKLFGAGPCSKM